MLHRFRPSLSIRIVVIALAMVSAASWLTLRTYSSADAAGLSSPRDLTASSLDYSASSKSEGRFLDRIASLGQSNDAFFDLVVSKAANASYAWNATAAGNPPAPPPSGPIVPFVIGNLNSAIGTDVMFWGAQWWSNNSLSGGAAPPSFKGYANSTTPNPPTCGGTWKSDPGNSSNPPSSVPPYITALVASSITKSGSVISGNIVKMVVIQTNPGYDGNPGHAGTGKVVAVYCAACVPGNVCRPATGICDVAEICDANGQCPANSFAGNGTSCSDGNACNGSETCNGGICTAGAPPNCDDNNACSADSCNAVTGCAHAPINCDDNNACTADSCDAVNGCRHTAVNVDDGNVCSTDSCDPATGVSHTPISCDDNNACTADSCDPRQGCVHTAVAVSDNNACTTDSCNPSTGEISHTAVDVDDRNACTTDSCDRSTGAISHTAVAVDDGNACTTDSCNPATGVTHTPISCGDDGNSCTADSCNPVSGCQHTPVANGTACSDGNACTQTDTCQAGTCTGSNPLVCTAADQCHDAGTCDPSSGQCSNPTSPDGTVCSDGDACTQSDTCQAGACTGSNPVVCVPSDQCHSAGTCDPGTGACSSPPVADDTPCDDGNACTAGDSCQAGTCIGKLAKSACDDGDPCTADSSCDPVTGCTHTPLCDDGDACTVDSCNPGGKGGFCVHTAVQCDDKNPCTADSCDPVSGCQNTPEADGTACDGGACQSGVCTAQTCTPPPPNMISWWAGDGNANDIQDGNDGTMSSGMTFVSGKVGQAFNCDGSHYVQIPSKANLLPPEQITVDGWIKPVFSGRPFQVADADTIIEKFDHFADGYVLGVAMDPTSLLFFEAPAGGVPLGTPAFFLNVGGIPNQIFSPVPIPDDGAFHFVAGTYDGATMRLFLDGVEVANRPVSGSILHAGSADVFIGHDNPFPRNSKAAIDEVEIFGRGLTATEIQNIFNAGSAGKCKPCPAGSSAFGGYCYEATSLAGPIMIVDGFPNYWETAEADCISRGHGHLVSIGSAAENLFVSSLVPNVGMIGFSDRGRAVNDFAWFDGSAVTYMNWAPGEPNNRLTPRGFENCAQISNGGVWNDAPCTDGGISICKFMP